ncbi:hypothetical protein Tco_0785945 [Tanacetum coccineum]
MATTIIDADLQGTPTDQTKYRSMIGGLMYLTASRLDIAFATFVCARYQARLTEKHLKEVKRIFYYLRQSINMGLWYSKDYGFDLIAYADADKLVIWSSKKQDYADKLVIRSSKKQDCTAMSIAEVEVQFPYLVIRYNILVLGTSTSDIILSRSKLNKLWKTVKKVPNTKDTISFTIDRETIIYTVDMFRDTRKMSVETLGHPFIVPSDLKFIPRFLKIVGYEGIVDKHSIKDDIPLRSVYSTGNVTVRGMLIPGELLNDDICATKEYQNEIRPMIISINTKFLNSLQPEWSKYRKKAARNHDPLALVAHSNVHSLHSHASPLYFHSPQPYYVTHPSSVIDHDEDYQRKIQGDAQEVKLTTAMMLLARAITQRYSIMQNVGRQNQNQVANARSGQIQQINAND